MLPKYPYKSIWGVHGRGISVVVAVALALTILDAEQRGTIFQLILDYDTYGFKALFVTLHAMAKSCVKTGITFNPCVECFMSRTCSCLFSKQLFVSCSQLRSTSNKATSTWRSFTHLELSKFCIIIGTRCAQNAPFPSIALVSNSLCTNRGHPFQLFTKDCDIMFRSNKWAIHPNQTKVSHWQGKFII